MKGSSLIRATATGPPKPYICRPCQRRFLHATRARRANDERPPGPSAGTTSIAGVNIGTSIQPTSSQPSVPTPRPTPDSNEITAADFKPYTPAELSQLRQHYTPAQMRAILAGERAVSPHDLATQTRFRTNDPWAIEYATDFAHHHPVLDKPIRAPESHHDPTQRFKTADEIKDDVTDFIARLPDSPTGQEFLDWRDHEARLMVGKEAAEREPIHYLAPEIPKGIPGLADRARKKKQKKEPPTANPTSSSSSGGSQREEEISPALARLMKQTGLTSEEIKRFRTKLLVSHRVVNQTRLGKIQSLYYLAVAGSPTRGLLGIGEGKSAEAGDARQQALFAAIRNLTPIPRYEHRTIFGDVKGKVGGVELELFNRPPGFGIRCQHLIHEMCRCAGIDDLAARVGRSRNKMNTVKAAMKALLGQRLPEEVSKGLGRKLVDARKVYYGVNL